MTSMLLALTVSLSLPDWAAYAGLGFVAGIAVGGPLIHPGSRCWLHRHARDGACWAGRQGRAWLASATDPKVFSWRDLGKAAVEGAVSGTGSYPVFSSIYANIGTIVPDPFYGALLTGLLTLLTRALNRYYQGTAALQSAAADGGASR